MADEQKLSISYHSPRLGLAGKGIISKLLERRLERLDAVHAFSEKNKVVHATERLKLDAKKIKITEAKIEIKDLFHAIVKGIQNSYNGLFEEMLLLKEKLERDKRFIQTDGSQLTLQDLRLYDEFLEIVSRTLEKARTKYITDAQAAAEGKEVAIAELETTTRYSLKRLFTPTLVEWWTSRSLAKATFRMEGKIIKLENKKTISEKTATQILKDNKIYAKDFEKLIERMLTYIIIMTRKGHESAEIIKKAVAEYNMPPAYGIYGERLQKKILSEDVKKGVLLSLYTSINQLEGSISELRHEIKKAESMAKREKVAA